MNDHLSQEKTGVESRLSRSNPSAPPSVPDHELVRCIGRGSYGEVWLARNVVGSFRAIKVVYRSTFSSDRPYEREFSGMKKFEPLSRSHDGLVDVLHLGRNDRAGYFYYVMELADDHSAECGMRSAESKDEATPSIPHSALTTPNSWTPEAYVPKTLASLHLSAKFVLKK